MKKHRDLVSLLMNELGDIAMDTSSGWEISLDDVWRKGKNVIITYDKGEIREEFPTYLFQSVRHRWGNVRSLEDLISYLRRVNAEGQPSWDFRPFSDMAQLTPNAGDVILDKFGGNFVKTNIKHFNIKISS